MGLKSGILFSVLVVIVGGVYFVHKRNAYQAQADLIIATCGISNSECLSDALSAIVLRDGTQRAFSILKSMYSSSEAISTQCFSLAGEVGRKTAARQPEFTKIDLAPESIFCNYGFYLIYSRERLLTTKDTTAAKEFCAYVSESVGSSSSDASAECFRGVGHALPFIDESLYGDAQKMALFGVQLCEELASTPREKDTCFSGVFSRLGYVTSEQRYGLSVEAKDPFRLCHELPEKYRGRCEGNYKRAIVDPIMSPVDFAMRIDALKKKFPLLSQSDLESVAFSVGYDNAHVNNARVEYETLMRFCAHPDQNLRDQCVSGTAVGLAKNGIPQEQGQQVLKLCEVARTVWGIDDASICPSEGALLYLKGFFPPGHFAMICRDFGLKTGVCIQ